tara:strand:+ start:237 stop:476 length:240 start_codon:yes stop_codon:yes gene_type:complete
MDKMEIKTHEDGWGCVPELQQAVKELETIDTFKYEIKNCVRVSSLNDMVYEMKDILMHALDKLDEIDTEVEYKTVEDND